MQVFPPFSNAFQMSRGWAKYFAARHHLICGKPQEVTEDSKATSSQERKITHFFEQLGKFLQEKELSDQPQLVWHVNEKGWSREQAPKSSGKVFHEC